MPMPPFIPPSTTGSDPTMPPSLSNPQIVPPPVGDSFSKLRGVMSKLSPKSFIKKHKQIKELQKSANDLNAKNATLTQQEADFKDKIKNAQIDALKKLYTAMQAMGVDPNNLDSIAAFRDKLMKDDPDLATLFFNAFDVLTQGLDTGSSAEATPQPDLMNNTTTNLQNGMIG